MINLGYYLTSGTRTVVSIPYSTFAASGANVAPSSSIDAADIRIYKAADSAALSATQRSSSSGITSTSPFDSLTGFHAVDIDLTDNTDAGFYAAGSRYFVVFSPSDETIDSLVITGVCIAMFEIGVPTANVTQWLGTAPATPTVAGVPKVDLSYILGTLLTETAGYLAAGFKKWFNVATPTSTMNQVTLVDTTTTLTNAPSDSAGVTTLLSRLSALRAGYLDNLSAGAVALASSLSTLQTDVTTLLGRITSTLFDGITSLKEWLGLIAGKQTGNTTARTELRATGAGSGTYDETTDSQEAMRDNMGTAQTGDSYAIVNNGTYGNSALNTDLDTLLSRLSALRAGYLDNLSGGAVALASALATLQTSVDDLPTNAELATALGTADDAVLAAIAALNNLSQANIRTALGMASANFDTQIGDLPTNAELATALGTADDVVLAAIAALNNLSAAQVNTEVDTAIADAALATAAALATVSTKLGAITGSGANTILGILKAMASKTATLPTDIGGTYDNATDALEALRDRGDSAWGAGAVPTVQEIVDGVWDEPIADHLDAGSTGTKLNSAASAGDPWSTPLPGAYAAGEAGYIIGNNIDGQISDLLGQTPDPIIVGNSSDCADVQVFDAGERKPIGGRLDITSGTFTISAVLCYLADADGTVVYGVNGLAATGYDTGSQTSPSFWYDLNTASPPSTVAMAVGTYDFWFKVTGTTSEGLTRVHEVHIVVQVV